MPDGSGWSADTRNWPPSARDAPANGMKQDNIATVKTGSAIGPIESMAANPRRIAPEALERLKASIQRDPEFMRLRPIVVDPDGIVIGGNQRLRACAELGIDPLPDGWVVRAGDLTDEQRRRFILVDNAPEGMSGAWDFEQQAQAGAGRRPQAPRQEIQADRQRQMANHQRHPRLHPRLRSA